MNVSVQVPFFVKQMLGLLQVVGVWWLLDRVFYRFKLKCGWFKRTIPCQSWGPHPEIQFASHEFFGGFETTSDCAVRQAEAFLRGEYRLFFRHTASGSFPPSWFSHPLGGGCYKDLRHWSGISDFGDSDIKELWELNRFSFSFALSRAYAVGKEERFADAFWLCVEDWRQENPPQCGPNWKCGQEISVRLMAWMYGYHAFRDSPASTSGRKALLAEMVETSGRRILKNIRYALSQKNNHGVVEAAGVFTAGIALGRKDWVEFGRGLLERQAHELIYQDGSFSQHSTNYHRVMLQTCLWAIQLGRSNRIPFRPEFLDRVRSAARWLYLLLDDSGKCPNLGGNDGAFVLPLSDCEYLDYRPTVQAAAAVIDGVGWLPAGPWDDLARCLGAEWRGVSSPPRDGFVHLSEGGYALFRRGSSFGMLRSPKEFRHRPAHCDLLHFDLWFKGRNILRDGGTYSYNCEAPWRDYFSGTAAHNTIQFDDMEQMPKLSRFLFGHWPKSRVVDCLMGESAGISAQFTDWRGCWQERTVGTTVTGFRVTDRVQGFREKAVLRWRLAPDLEWEMDGDLCRSEECMIRVTAQPGPVLLRLGSGWESLHYLERNELPVLEASVACGPQKFVTEVVLLA